ncbi:hypothetical protein [Acinetobacter sp. ANC 3813]|uniref:hypothetical protein n=1 Tax=Acinetobacter sp. ANC 3813 TaxID=1977873 RepID=UPI001BB46E90|nr:hypothetical protein [Acinetobacter sp. ANC 3813]
MSFEYINKNYGVNAEVGRCVIADGEAGVIVGYSGAHIVVNLDKDKPNVRSNWHPTWHMVYGEMGKVRPLTAGQKRYQEFLNADSGLSFAEWLGVDKASKAHREYMKSVGY